MLFYPTLYNWCNHLSMLGFKIFQVSKGCPRYFAPMYTLITRFMVGPMLAPWTSLSGYTQQRSTWHFIIHHVPSLCAWQPYMQNHDVMYLYYQPVLDTILRLHHIYKLGYTHAIVFSYSVALWWISTREINRHCIGVLVHSDKQSRWNGW